LLERPGYSAAVHCIANWLVLGGIAIESLCTFSLFVFDERISDAQQSKVIALETRLAPRVLPANKWAEFVSFVKAFPGTQFDIGISQPDPEFIGLLVPIEHALWGAEARWKEVSWQGTPVIWVREPVGQNVGTSYVTDVVIAVDASEVTKPLATAVAPALVAALNNAGIPAIGPIGMDISKNVDAIHILIGRRTR
jgi:hypothetical protein